MRPASALAYVILLFSFSFAGEFLCGGVGGIPCTTDCQGHWSESMHAYVSCECPQGHECVCYCPVEGEPHTGTGEISERPTTSGSFPGNAPACESSNSQCTGCGLVASISGRIGIQRNGEWCLAYSGLAIQPGDLVYSPGDSKARIKLFDGGTMDVAPGSSFIFRGVQLSGPTPAEAIGSMVMESAEGAYHFLMDSDRIGQFEIRTNGAYTGIEGTEFIVEATGSYTKVKVLEGAVSFWKSGSDARVLVNEGESSVLYGGSPAPTAPQAFNVAGESRWWSGLDGSCCGTAFILMFAPLLAAVFRSNRQANPKQKGKGF